jgi:hypothetical protein
MEKNTSSEHMQQNRGDEHKQQSNYLLLCLRHGVTNT